MKILVIEDEPVSALSVTWELESAGHTVLGPVSNIEDALRLARMRRPELALVDIDLQKEGDGVRLARQFRELDIAVVFVTGKGNIGEYAEFALGYIGKPYNPADLPGSVAAISAIMHGERPANAPLSLRLFEPVASWPVASW
jgi:DNA-binding response OmpR family regulator